MTRAIDPLTRYDETSSGCWEWTGPLNDKGYGKHGKKMAHRQVFEIVRGAIPAGIQLDHLCRNRQCVNPDHLEPVTPRENTMRSPIAPAAVRARSERCKSGHDLAGDNLYIDPNGYRRCRACVVRWQRDYKARRREHRTAA